MSDLEKAPDAYRIISEVSEQLDVPQHVLRFWETKFPQVAPMKRAGNRRYYRPEHVGLLAQIRDLLYVEGYTTKGVQKLLEEGRLTAAGVHGGDADLAPRQVRGQAGKKSPSSSLLDLTTGQGAQSVQGEESASEAPALVPKAIPQSIDAQSLSAIEARLQAAKARLAAAMQR